MSNPIIIIITRPISAAAQAGPSGIAFALIFALMLWPLLPMFMLSPILGMAALCLAIAIPAILMLTFAIGFTLELVASIFFDSTSDALKFQEAHDFEESVIALKLTSLEAHLWGIFKLPMLYCQLVSELLYRFFHDMHPLNLLCGGVSALIVGSMFFLMWTVKNFP